MTKGEFFKTFASTTHQRVRTKFTAKKHKTPKEWRKTIKRPRCDWLCKNPESFHNSISGWHWLRRWFALPDSDRPTLGSAWQSKLVRRKLLLSSPDGKLYMCIGSSNWGVLTLAVETVQDPMAEIEAVSAWQNFRISVPVEIIHVTDIQRWKCVPWVELSPAALQAHCTCDFSRHVYFRKTADDVPLLNAIFDCKCKIGVGDQDL